MLEQASDAIYCARSALSEDDTCLLFMLTLRTAPSINHAHSEMIQIYNTGTKADGESLAGKVCTLNAQAVCGARREVGWGVQWRGGRKSVIILSTLLKVKDSSQWW